MPYFNRTSHIYSPDEVNILRSCLERSASLLKATHTHYDEDELATTVIRLYDSGLRDLDHLVELAAQMVTSRKISSKSDEYGTPANLNKKS